MTDSQKEALHQAGRKTWEQRIADWSRCLDLAKIDLRSLQQDPTTSDCVPGPSSLRAAVAAADVVVVATVAEVQPTAMNGTESSFSISRTLKGPSRSTLDVKQSWGLYPPNPDYTGIVIALGCDNMPLLPGDRAILFLEKLTDGTYSIEVSGAFPVSGGAVHAQGYPAWQRSADGETEAEFVQQVKSVI